MGTGNIRRLSLERQSLSEDWVACPMQVCSLESYLVWISVLITSHDWTHCFPWKAVPLPDKSQVITFPSDHNLSDSLWNNKVVKQAP